MYNIEADIVGTNYFQKDGVEARQLFLDGLIKTKNSYVCYDCKIPLKPANVEKYLTEDLKVRPHFKKKELDHLKSCIYYEEENYENNLNVNKRYENVNDSRPIILKVPEFDIDTLEIIESDEVKTKINLIHNNKNNSELIQREAKTSYNKLSFFANQYLIFDQMFGRDYKAKDEKLLNEELYISSIRSKDENNYYNYFKHAKTVNEGSIYFNLKYMRVFWSYIGDKVIEFEDRFDCYIDDNRIFRINKKHITKGIVIKKRNVFLYTIPKQDETGRFIFNSTDFNLTSVLPYKPKN